MIDPFEGFLRERVLAFPDLSGARLLREIRAMGYEGSYTAVTDFLRDVRPSKPPKTRPVRKFKLTRSDAKNLLIIGLRQGRW